MHRPITDTSALLERFPHLGAITELWGSPECRAYLNHLLTDTRDGQRRGFPPEHAKTLFSLLTEHDDSFPELQPELGVIGLPEDLRRYNPRFS